MISTEAYMSPQELQVQQKRELEKKQESTAPARLRAHHRHLRNRAGPDPDRGDAGRRQEQGRHDVEDGVLTIQGQLDFSKYEGMQPVYTEYNVGHYRRSFSLSNKIDQSRISADMKDGVLTRCFPRRSGQERAGSRSAETCFAFADLRAGIDPSPQRNGTRSETNGGTREGGLRCGCHDPLPRKVTARRAEKQRT